MRRAACESEAQIMSDVEAYLAVALAVVAIVYPVLEGVVTKAFHQRLVCHRG